MAKNWCYFVGKETGTLYHVCGKRDEYWYCGKWCPCYFRTTITQYRRIPCYREIKRSTAAQNYPGSTKDEK
jgi:hypothetical protein